MTTQQAARDLVTPDSGAAPVVSIVVPCLNERVTVGEFVDWCFEGLADAGVTGEVLIVDSSTDESPEIAAERGALVVSVPKRGLGRAYVDALPHVNGRIVIMGDCDLTYDFRQLKPFIEAVDAGHEFVMGTRTRGEIEPGAMPALHRYFGSPLTTLMFNIIYGTRFSDIHCGMRALTTDAMTALDLQSDGWEYASEMILKAKRLGLPSTEVPVRFWKDREGRESHLKRGGWKTPWIAGWDSLRVMFLYAPDFFLLKPGAFLLTIGLLLNLALSAGPFHALGIEFDLHWMLFGVVCAAAGDGAVQLALLARAYYDFDGRTAARILRVVTYNRGVAASAVLILAGLIPCISLLARWVAHGYRLAHFQYSSVLGLMLILLGFQTFGFTLILHMVGHHERRAKSR
jgi:glycosyltransferase involved in cell wall biosynthesis